MNNNVKAKWVEALRSGKYVKTEFALKKFNFRKLQLEYCALGVLCDLYLKEQGRKWGGNHITGFYVDSYSPLKIPSHEVMKWSGLRYYEPSLSEFGFDVGEINDCKEFSFKEIANIIEECL